MYSCGIDLKSSVCITKCASSPGRRQLAWPRLPPGNGFSTSYKESRGTRTSVCIRAQTRFPTASRHGSEDICSSPNACESRGSHEGSSSADESSSAQRWALDALATAGSNVPLRSTVVLLGIFAVLLANGGVAHASDGLHTHTQHFTAQPVFGDIAGEEDFWGNVGAYFRFFVTVMLGTVNVVTKPFRDAAKSPATTAAVVLGGVALFAFMSFTVKLMLGIGEDSNFEYLTRGV